MCLPGVRTPTVHAAWRDRMSGGGLREELGSHARLIPGDAGRWARGRPDEPGAGAARDRHHHGDGCSSAPAARPSRIAARSVPLGSGGVSAGRVGLQGGYGERVERADGLGEGEDLAVHQALVELVQVKQLRLPRVPGLQQIGGRRAQRDGAEPGRVQR